MQLTATAEYGLLALVSLAWEYGTKRYMTGSKISKQHGVSPGSLANALWLLAQTGLVEKARGSAGGFRLARHPAQISLWEILEAVSPLPRVNARSEAGAALAKRLRCVDVAEEKILRGITLLDLLEWTTRAGGGQLRDEPGDG